jgi:hypothetical protein
VIFSYSLDPAEILGVPATASIQEIREAYRAKTKLYHPDKGGDEWAFRVVTKAHELMCTARVAGRVSEESRPAPAPTAAANPFAPIDPDAAQKSSERRIKPDAEVAEHRKIDVEMLIIRFENENPLTYLLESAEHRNLSCSVNVSWPSSSVDIASIRTSHADSTLETLQEAFDKATTAVRAIAARSSIDEGRFAGWLTYSSVSRAEDGFKALRNAFQNAGFGIVRSVREVSIPRTWDAPKAGRS